MVNVERIPENSLFYYQNQWLHGPLSVDQLTQMARAGVLSPDTPVWQISGAAWLTARYFLEVAAGAPDETPVLSAQTVALKNLPPPRLFYALRSAFDKNILTADQSKKCAAELAVAPHSPDNFADYLRENDLITAGQASDLTRLLQADVTQKIIGGYELLDELGAGAIGITYKARQISLDRIVAMKVLAPKFNHDRDFVNRFFREARLAAKLDHQNIAAMYAVGVVGDVHFIVMEYVDGFTLAQVLKNRGRLPETEAIGYLTQIASALNYAYECGILHRDISCKNIMVSQLGQPKLIDLGLASEKIPTGNDRNAGAGVGTPAYMSPEQAGDGSNIDIRSDIYSLGCVFYQMLCGNPPFEGEDAAETIKMHLEQNVPEITAQNVSIGTRAIVRKMTRRDISQRYQSVFELLNDLNNTQQVAFTESLSTMHALPEVETQIENSRQQDRVEIAIPGNKREYLRSLAIEIERRLNVENAPAEFHGFVQSMFAELSDNAFDHGIVDEQGLVYIRMEFNPAFFRLEVEDSGNGFDAKALFREIRTNPAASKRKRGLGYIAQIVDLFEYNKKGNKVKAVIYRREQENGVVSEMRGSTLFIDVVGSGSVDTNAEFCRFVNNYQGDTNVCLSVCVNWVSSLFVGAMVDLANRVTESNMKMAVWVEQSGCYRIVKQLGVTALIDTYPTRTAAIAAVS